MVPTHKDNQQHVHQLTLLLDHLPEPVVSVGTNFTITYWNRAAETLFKMEAVEVLGKPFFELFLPQPGATPQIPFEHLLNQKNLRLEAALPDGSRLMLDAHIAALPADDEIHQDAQGWVITLHPQPEPLINHNLSSEDLTRLLQENRRQNELLERMIHDTPAGIAFLQVPDFRYTLSNQAYNDMARGKGNLIGRTVAEVWPETADIVLPLLESVYKTGKPYFSENKPFPMVRDKGFEMAYFTLSYTPVTGTNGEVEGILVMKIETTQQMQLHHAIEVERDWLRAVLSSMDDEVWYIDPQGNTTILNQSAKDRLGIETLGSEPAPMKEAVLDQLEILNPDGTPRPVEDAPLYAALRGKNVRGEEIVRHGETGKLMYRLYNCNPIFSDNGEVIGAVSVTRDITDRKQAEQELRDSENKFRQLADSMPQLVWTARPDGAVDYYNQRVHEYDGITPMDDGTWNWNPMLHEDDLKPTIEAWQRAIETGEEYKIEHRVRMIDGSYRWHLSRCVPARDENGQIIKWFGTATNIHDQKLVQEALHKSEIRMRRLVDANIIGIIIRGEDGLISDANDAFLNIIGYTREDLQAGLINWKQITPPEYIPYDIEATSKARQNGSFMPYEKEYIRKDGSRVPILIGYALIDNSKTEYIGFILDLSDLKQAQAALEEYAAKLERSNQELEQFAFVASHDLQEPLRKIRLFGEVLSNRLENRLDDETRDYLNRMLDAAARMQAMITGLLELSRINTRGQDFVNVDLNAVMRDVISDLETRINQTHGKVEVEPLPTIEADPLQMRRLMQNLVSNALKYSRQEVPPVIHITGKVIQPESGKPKQVILRVEDNGIGFEMEYLERIFQPFQRLHGRGVYEGTGIGLSICQRIVERHGGNLTAESIPDQGSVFIVTLPLRQSPDEPGI